MKNPLAPQGKGMFILAVIAAGPGFFLLDCGGRRRLPADQPGIQIFAGSESKIHGT